MTLAPLQQQIISLCRWVTFPVRAEIGKQAFPLAAVQPLSTQVISGIFAFWFFHLPLFGYRMSSAIPVCTELYQRNSLRCNFASSGMNHGPSIAKNAVT